jgi:hypothetical protein
MAGRILGPSDMQRIFDVADPMGISREALVIPLRAEGPGRVTRRRDGKLEVLVADDRPFEEWLADLPASLGSHG